MHSLDEIDLKLLSLLQADATRSTADLADEVGVATASLWRRIERLEASGIIKSRSVRIDPKALGYEIEVSLRVTLDKTKPDVFDSFIAAARNIPEVNEIQTFLGRVDVRLNVLARDLEHYQDIYRNQIMALPDIADIEALMLISNIQAEERLPI